MSKGGIRAFRGSPSTADAYLTHEGAAGSLDEYLAEGQRRHVQYGVVGAAGTEVGSLDSEDFRAWMEHYDPVTKEQRGTFRTRAFIDKNGDTQVGGTPLYQETIISSSKSLSLAAAADPRIGEALEAAQARAAIAAGEALHEHAVTRVGPKGAQRHVAFEQIEHTSVQHKTSRAGDPHYHRHVQVLPKGYAEGQWRAMDGKTLYRLNERLHAAADLSMATDVELRQAIAEAGYTWEPGEGGGMVAEFESLTDDFSSRRDQIALNRESLEMQWRTEHPGQEPGSKQLQAFDQYGWAQQRPEKKSAVGVLDPDDLQQRLGGVAPQNMSQTVAGQTARQIHAGVIANSVLDDLAQQRSAWSSADLAAAIDRRLAETYLIGNDGVDELRAEAMQTAQQDLVNFFDEGTDVEGVRHYTSQSVISTEKQLTNRLVSRAESRGSDGVVEADRGAFTLTQSQVAAAQAIAGDHPLVVIEGAAGSGKTAMLEAANEQLTKDGRRLVAVSPTKRGAIEMGAAIGAEGNSVHSMLVRAGASFDDRGTWTLPAEWKDQPPQFRMDSDTVLVVDEAGMVDQQTAAALHRYADDQGVGSLVLTGDTKQLSAVGRGGYLARAAQLSGKHLDLRDVQRFKTADGHVDQAYADASLKLRDRQEADQFYDLLATRGQVHLGTDDEVIDRVAETVALEVDAGQSSVAIASTNATAQRINHAVYERLAATGVIEGGRVVHGRDGDPIAAGARIATRQNDRELGVANRQTWTVKEVNDDGRIVVKDEDGHHRTLDADYVSENVQLYYAATAHGAQGMTVDTAHTVLSDQMDAAGAYVGLTRGRRANVLHAVAVDERDSREQFTAAMDRASADEGLTAARAQARRDLADLDSTTDHVMNVDMSFLDRHRTSAARHETKRLVERVQAGVEKAESYESPAMASPRRRLPTMREKLLEVKENVKPQQDSGSAEEFEPKPFRRRRFRARAGEAQATPKPETSTQASVAPEQVVAPQHQDALERLREQYDRELRMVSAVLAEHARRQHPGRDEKFIDAHVEGSLRGRAHNGTLAEDLEAVRSDLRRSTEAKESQTRDTQERESIAESHQPAQDRQAAKTAATQQQVETKDHGTGQKAKAPEPAEETRMPARLQRAMKRQQQHREVNKESKEQQQSQSRGMEL